LAADNQYAHLGLALLGALAQVHTAVASLVPVPDDGLKSDAVSPAGTVVRRDVPEESDLGVVISRSEIEQGVPLRADKTKVKKPTVDDGVLESTETRNQDESTGAGPRDSRNGAEKLKKLKKDRDEFDSLFDSLEAKPAKEEEEEAEERRRVR
jgi:ribonuclease MRP protein subunit RMP1